MTPPTTHISKWKTSEIPWFLFLPPHSLHPIHYQVTSILLPKCLSNPLGSVSIMNSTDGTAQPRFKSWPYHLLLRALPIYPRMLNKHYTCVARLGSISLCKNIRLLPHPFFQSANDYWGSQFPWMFVPLDPLLRETPVPWEAKPLKVPPTGERPHHWSTFNLQNSVSSNLPLNDLPPPFTHSPKVTKVLQASPRLWQLSGRKGKSQCNMKWKFRVRCPI